MNPATARARGAPTFLVTLFLLLGTLSGTLAAQDDGLAGVKAALRGHAYARAAKLAENLLEQQGKGAANGEVLYLLALARYHGKQPALAERTTRELLQSQQSSPWRRKATFLLARVLIDQRRHADAQAIYEAEARRLLSGARKEEIAGLLVRHADELARPRAAGDPGPPPDLKRAVKLYGEALGLEISRGFRDDILFKQADTLQRDGSRRRNQGLLVRAVQAWQQYLKEYDPAWSGPVGSPARRTSQARRKPPAAGKHRLEARYRLGLAQRLLSQMHAARVNFEDLVKLLGTARAEVPAAELQRLREESTWQIVLTHGMPQPGSAPERGIAAARAYLEAWPGGRHAVRAAWSIASAFAHHGRSDDALAAFEAFIEGRGYSLPEGAVADEQEPGATESARALHDRLLPEATFQVAAIRFKQERYEDAIRWYERYVNRFPNGPRWSASQEGIIDARYRQATDALARGAFAEARELMGAFLMRHPLDSRSRRVMFILGQVRHHEAAQLEKDDSPAEKVREAWLATIAEWKKLVSKYPKSEEASVAQYRIGLVLEQKLGDLEGALGAWRKLTWGSKAAAARARVQLMSQKELDLRTERSYRTDETARVRLRVRNIEKVTIRQYFLALEPYFRKTHGIEGIEKLDIGLIQADRTWELKIPDYAKYMPLDRFIDVPFGENKPGVCILQVTENDLEASTLVLRSDLDLIIKSSRREVLAFVQNRRTGKPAPGTRILLSDGKRVFARGVTSASGVFQGSFKELKDLESVRVFAMGDGGVASNALNLAGLGLSSGLTARGYVYTDRPAYQPGQDVGIRGILRGVKDGSYAVSSGMWTLGVRDPAGRLAWQQDVELSRFGTFTGSVALPAEAPLGKWTVTVHPAGKPGAGHGGSFVVDRFVLRKLALDVESDVLVCTRGDEVKLTALASWSWGEPLRDRELVWTLPDGLAEHTRTDSEGRASITFDTSGITSGGGITFSAQLPADGLSTLHRVWVSQNAFGLSVSPSRPVALAGEPVEAVIRAVGVDGKPLRRRVTLTVLRRTLPRAIPVLSEIPWETMRTRPPAEITVHEVQVETDAKTGEARVPVTLKEGGAYVLRVSAEDRSRNAVVSSASLTVSGDEDATRLRLFAGTTLLKVGEKASIRLHSRAAEGLALVTFEGETVLAWRVVRVKPGYNDLTLDVGNEHFPNFQLSVAMMDGRDLRTAALPFSVARQLEVTLKPERDRYQPGKQGRVTLQVTDQLGQPVEAELSLALVNAALFGLHADATPRILDFFQKGVVRKAGFRTTSTCGFGYQGITRKVLKVILAEQDRQRALVRAEREYKEARRSLEAQLRVRGAKREQAGKAGVRFKAAKPSAPAESAADEKSKDAFVGFLGQPSARPPVVLGNKLRFDHAADMPTLAFGREAQEARREVRGAGVWVGSVVTDREGRASITLDMPATTTAWRLTARGCTTDTLVGEARAKTVTARDLFVTFKAPESLLEGDRPRPLARVHNLTDWKGPASVTLRVRSGDRLLLERSKDVQLAGRGSADALFEAFPVPPLRDLRFEIAVVAGDRRDAVSQAVPVRPWGLELADHAGGSGDGPVRAYLQLPKGRSYGARWLTVAIGARPRRALVDLALGGGAGPLRSFSRRPGWSRLSGGELLAAASVIGLCDERSHAPDRRRLVDRTRALVAGLVVGQRKDGGWNGFVGRSRASLEASILAYRGLVAAARAGVVVPQGTLQNARRYLQNSYRRSSNDGDRAHMLAALASTGHADFAHLNRLHRQRNRLGAAALAALALAFHDQDRREIARELLPLLEARAKSGGNGDAGLVWWQADQKSSRIFGTAVETTALALEALCRINPASTLVRGADSWLQRRRGCRGLSPARSRGPVVAALAASFRLGEAAENDYVLRVRVNGKDLKRITARKSDAVERIEVPEELLVPGRNRVSLDMEGRGSFTWAATLRGFTSSFAKAGWRGRPYTRERTYRHDTLRYRGKALPVASTSRVQNAETGQRLRTYVNIRSGSRRDRYTVIEETLPAGCRVEAPNLAGRGWRVLREAGRLVILVPPGRSVSSFQYDLVGDVPGEWRALPTVIRDLEDPAQLTIGKGSEINVLAPGEHSRDPYTTNTAERYHLGRLYFEDGDLTKAFEYLKALRAENISYSEREVARMLLWIGTSEGYYDAQLIVDMFEILRERHPDLTIPFDRILTVGRAYKDIGEFERSWLVYRATVEASFVKDSNVSAVLQDQGRFLGSVEYQRRLWQEYPDSAQVSSAFFALSQALYREAPRAARWAKLAKERKDEGADKITTASLLRDTAAMLTDFLALYPEHPLADDAAFSLTNALLDLKDHEAVIALGVEFARLFPKSEFTDSFRYMTALGHFWLRHYEPAMSAARTVAQSESKDRDLARYILGQIQHAKGNADEAIRWYEKIAKRYPDAKEAIEYFRRKSIGLPEVTVFQPGRKVALDLKFRNIKELAVQVYRVDLMRLYLREKNLRNITGVNLAGIASQIEVTRKLGDGKDYRERKLSLPLDLKAEGAYLVIARGDDLFTSGLVLVTPLVIEAQEEVTSGRVRVNVIDAGKGTRPAEVHVKAIGSGDSAFKSGETDLRGLFVADGINGRVTVIAREGDARYAFYRGKQSLGAGERPQRGRRPGASKARRKSVDYRKNLLDKNSMLQQQQLEMYDNLRRQKQQGVQIKKAR